MTDSILGIFYGLYFKGQTYVTVQQDGAVAKSSANVLGDTGFASVVIVVVFGLFFRFFIIIIIIIIINIIIIIIIIKNLYMYYIILMVALN